MAGKPSLELAVEVIDANGTRYRWDDDAFAENRATGKTFGTKIGDGFAQGGCTLPRRVDGDFPDIGLKNDFAFVGADGEIAYEGRIAATPRSFGQDGHSISVSTAGWMSYAKQRKFSMPFVDRDLSKWRQASIGRRAVLATASLRDDGFTTGTDVANLAALVLSVRDTWASPFKPISEAWYEALPGTLIGAVWYDVAANANLSLATAAWDFELYSNDNDGQSGSTYASLTGDLIPGTGAFASNQAYATLATARRYLMWQLQYTATPSGTAGAEQGVFIRNPAVYGNHGLTRRGSDPGGFYASDVIRWIAENYCPKLDVSGVQDTTFAIPHLVFDRAFPFDAFLEVNKYHGWNLAVWENRKLTFEPFDLTDYDWEIRLDDPGVEVQFQGDSTEDFYNGVVVTYPDVDTGKTEVLTPDDDPTLADTSIANPSNAFGEDDWYEATISVPTDAAGAVQIGRMLLAEKNAPKAPGQYRVTGHIKDRAGHWQQAWKVRAGDTVAITSSTLLSDRPHLIVETSYDDDSKTMTIGVDNTLIRADAIMDRFGVALQAAGLL